MIIFYPKNKNNIYLKPLQTPLLIGVGGFTSMEAWRRTDSFRNSYILYTGLMLPYDLLRGEKFDYLSEDWYGHVLHFQRHTPWLNELLLKWLFFSKFTKDNF